MTHRQTHLPIIQKAHTEGWLRSLSIYYKIKILYRNSTIYNYSPNTLARLLDLSANTIRKHIKILERHDLVRYHSGNLTCVSIISFKKINNKRCTIHLKKEYSLKQIEHALLSKPLEAYTIANKKIVYRKRRDKDLLMGNIEPRNARDIRRQKYLKRNIGKYENEFNDKVIFSFRKLSIKLGIGINRLTEMLKFLSKEGIISYFVIRKRLYKQSYKSYCSIKDNLQGYTYWHNGWSYYVEGSFLLTKQYFN